MAKRFINRSTNVVPDLMQGLALDSCRVTLLSPDTGHHVAVRAALADNTQTPRVSVVTGGGSGHEPMAAGYVGDGMLAASVAGAVFAAPSVTAISAMLEVVAPRSTGILLVVMNYQGDRLNFDKATQLLLRKSPGYPMHTVLVSDDVALPNVKQPRGIAGTVFVLKVAGAAADQGRSFQEVVNVAEMATRSVVSFGVSLEPCTIPGHSVDTERLNPDEIELGMGIHGEPGAERRQLSQMNSSTLTQSLVGDMCIRLDVALQQRTELSAQCTGLAILVNNLGAVSQCEMLIVCKAVADYVYSGQGIVLNGQVYPRMQMFCGGYLTSLQMAGVSLSVFLIPDDRGFMKQFLAADTECTAWVKGFQVCAPAVRKVVPRVVVGATGAGAGIRRAAGGATAGSGFMAGPAANVYLPTDSQMWAAYPGVSPAAVEARPAVASVYQPPVRSNVPPQAAAAPVGLNMRTGVYVGETARSGAARTVTGLGVQTEMNILAVTSALQSHCDDLTALDRRTGDGDFGDTVRRGCQRIREDLEQGRYAHSAKDPGALFRAIAQSTETMGGSSGGLTGAFLEAAAETFDNMRGYNAEIAWHAAFVGGTQAVMQQGGAQVGDRTLVDALKPAADVLQGSNGDTLAAKRAAHTGSGSGVVEGLREAAHAARVGFEATKLMTTARFGRSVHVRPDKLLNQPDPGALAIVIILDALVDAPDAGSVEKKYREQV